MRALWVDTNVLLRFLTADPPDLAEQALALIRKAESGELVLRVSTIVAAEMVWVLTSFYKTRKSEIAAQLSALFSAPGIAVEERDIILAALAIMAEKNVDFADALLAEIARAHHEPVVTFDDDFDRIGVERAHPATA